MEGGGGEGRYKVGKEKWWNGRREIGGNEGGYDPTLYVSTTVR